MTPRGLLRTLGSSARLLWPALLPAAGAAVLLALGQGVLDYHSALALAPLSALGAALLASGQPQPGRERLRWLVLLAAPLALLLAAAPWRPSCDLWHGLGFWVLGPTCSALVGAGMGTVARHLAPARRWLRGSLLAALLLGSCVPAALAFLKGPQLFGYAPPVGWVAGALYEDGVALHWGYLAYRLIDLATWLPVLAIRPTAVIGHSPRDCLMPVSARQLAGRVRSDAQLQWLLALPALALTVGWLRAGPERWRIDPADVASVLPVELQLRHGECGGSAGDATVAMTLHLPSGLRRERARQLLRHDACFRYLQLRQWFGRPAQPVHLYAWPDVRTKQRWTGAARVEMAKPWLGQAHLVLPELGATVLSHELAHVFAAGWSRSPLGIPLRYGVLPDALAIEGVAVAAEWPMRGGLTPHQWARASRQLGKGPPIEKLLTPSGFLTGNSDLAYTTAGSLVRWLRDTRGVAAVQELYATGDWQAAAGMPVDELAKRWAVFVEDAAAHPLSDADLQRARARFEPPGIFERPCALAVGRCRDRAGLLQRVGRPQLALAEWQRLRHAVLANTYGPEDPDLAWEYVTALASAGDVRAASAALQQWLDQATALQPPLHRLQRAMTLSVLGDLSFHSGDLGAAQMRWRAAADAPVAEAMLRTLEVKQALAEEPKAKAFLTSQLLAGGPVARPGAVFLHLARELPDHPVAAYLVARRALRLNIGEGPVLQLEALLPRLRQGWPWIAREAARLVALHRARLGQCEALVLPELAQEAPSWKAELELRCRHAAAQSPSTLPRRTLP